jgi:hypothetical protein
MRQLQLFTGTQVATMRDRTRRRNYSPEAEAFRRDHERRREFGLKRRHAERERRLRSGKLVTQNGFLVHRHSASPITETSERPPAEAVPTAPAVQSAHPAAPVDVPRTDKPLPLEGRSTNILPHAGRRWSPLARRSRKPARRARPVRRKPTAPQARIRIPRRDPGSPPGQAPGSACPAVCRSWLIPNQYFVGIFRAVVAGSISMTTVVISRQGVRPTILNRFRVCCPRSIYSVDGS